MNLISRLIDLALDEDLGIQDITTDALISSDQKGRGYIVAKESLILAGVDIAKQVFKQIDSTICFQDACNDGVKCDKGNIILTVDGSLATILKGERVALNFLQRMSGIATHVRSFTDQVQDSSVQIVDTRKTTPGWRVLEKYAVRVGGAKNHRFGLYDGILIKDNHITACGGIKNSIEKARKAAHHLLKIEIETETLSQVQEALDAGADIIMLDNMTIEQINEAVALINKRTLIEVSGGVRKEYLKTLAATGVDIISIGALTHSANSVDIHMRIETIV